jgi:hypothetical protein
MCECSVTEHSPPIFLARSATSLIGWSAFLELGTIAEIQDHHDGIAADAILHPGHLNKAKL